MSRAHTNGNDVDIDIARLFVAVWDRRLAIVSLILIVCAIAFVVSGTIAPRYRAESRVLIEAREQVFSLANRTERGQAQYLDEQGIGSQVEIINSTNLIKSVAEQLDLVDDPEFSAAAKPSITTSILIMLGVSSDPYDVPPEERLIETFRKHLTVYQVSKTRVIAISFWSTNRQLSAKVANAIADAYLNVQSGAKLISNADTTAWLEPEIADLRDKVRTAEARVAEYRAKSGLLLVNETATIATQQLAEISTELSRVRGNKAEAQARATAVAKAIEDGYSTEQFANTTQSEVIRRLRERQAALQSDIADLSVTLLDGHPRIKGLRSQLRDIDVQIKAEAKNLLRGFENEAEVAQLRENELVAQLDSLKADSARAGGEEVELRALEREATAQRELLEAYLSRYREAASRSDRGNLPADARVISEALVPIKPYFPKTMPIVIIAGLVTFLLASIIIMMRELFSGRALKPVDYGKPIGASAQADQIEVPKPAPYIPQREVAPPGSDIVMETTPDAPAEKDEPEIETLPHDIDEPVVEEAERINLVPHSDDEYEPVPIVEAAEADAPAPETDRHVLIDETDVEYSVSAITGHLIASETRIAVVVSPEGDKGSTTSVMLARMLANEGRQTLLVDMTGSACPSRMMVPQNDLPGITNILADECTVPEALHADRLSNAHILPQGTVDPGEAMHYAERLPAIIGSVSNVYEIVVVECGPANSAGVKRLLDDHDVEMIFSVVQPEEHVITEYLTDFYSEGFKHLLMMSPGAGTPNRPDRSAA
ncbi:MAG: chain-length determining protein [Hyphomicrobiales bacterium]|nr:chain-length determining protein [Hyphomicrobiales bacterium]MCP5000334.1 chain-length determining protein [Hyphomicrobiales bacterium]